MDYLSLAGLVLAVIAVVVGATLKGAGIQALVSLAAFFIVVVGTIAAVCVQTSLTAMKRALSMVPWIVKPPRFDAVEIINTLVEWSSAARRQGLLGLEDALQDPTLDDFLRKGLQLVVDGSEPELVRRIMEVELTIREQNDTRAAKVFEGMGVYAPTLGIIGAVLGLMSVLQNLADPTKLGHGIAAAFVATVYGIGLANLVFLPVANKLKGVVQTQAQLREMMIEGLVSIAQGENPRNIEMKLQGFLH